MSSRQTECELLRLEPSPKAVNTRVIVWSSPIRASRCRSEVSVTEDLGQPEHDVNFIRCPASRKMANTSENSAIRSCIVTIYLHKIFMDDLNRRPELYRFEIKKHDGPLCSFGRFISQPKTWPDKKACQIKTGFD